MSAVNLLRPRALSQSLKDLTVGPFPRGEPGPTAPRRVSGGPCSKPRFSDTSGISGLVQGSPRGEAALPLASCVTLGKLLHCPGPQFSHL